MTMPPLEGAPFRLERYHAQCIHLSWQSSPANDGRRYFMSVHEPLPNSNPKQPVAPWIRTLRTAFPGAAFEKISSEIDHMMIDYRMTVAMSGGRFISHKAIGNTQLPSQLPDDKAASKMKVIPLKDLRGTIARAFAADGWKPSSTARQGFACELWKLSGHRRRLTLRFHVQRHRGAPPTMISTIHLSIGRKKLNLGVPAERSTRHEYPIPNPEVLDHFLANVRAVASYLEQSWVREVEDLL